MGTYAKVIADSISEHGVRITTLELRYWRFIHSEFMTHRMFSRNASSSRAIPVNKMIDWIEEDPAIPIYWGKNKPGMQAVAEADSLIKSPNTDLMLPSKDAWFEARDSAILYARAFAEAGYHKQLVNRILEPFSWITVCVTATDWKNFYALRDHSAAQPEIKNLAVEMKSVTQRPFVEEDDDYYEFMRVHMGEVQNIVRDSMESSQPAFVGKNDWHLPYVQYEDWQNIAINSNIYDLDPNTGFNQNLIKVSAARCARVSYKTHEGKTPEIDQDLKLYYDLYAEKHVSPFEHQATPFTMDTYIKNFRGWKSHRSMVEGEWVPG
jgi:thymidylate synthase ThyX